jgi:hypothetical protein
MGPAQKQYIIGILTLKGKAGYRTEIGLLIY